MFFEEKVMQFLLIFEMAKKLMKSIESEI